MAFNILQAKAALADESLQRELLEDELDEFDEPEHIREARVQALKREMEMLRTAKENACGELQIVEEEKELFAITTSQPRVVCHFYHEDFRRCAIMNERLETLAKMQFTTKFIKFPAEKAPFLVTKLKIQVLPTVLSFVNGIVKDRITGFEDLGNSDNFTIKALERRLSKCGVLQCTEKVEPGRKTVFGYTRKQADDTDSDEDD